MLKPRRSPFIIAALAVLPLVSGFGQVELISPPPIVNFSRYDIEAAGFSQSPGVPVADPISDTLARRVVNFRYMRAGGVVGAIFQTSYIDRKTKSFKVDDSFRVWGQSAAANGIRLGVYHFYRPGLIDDAKQAKMFLDTVKQTCLDHPDWLKGQPILIAIDATTVGASTDTDFDKANLQHVDKIIHFLEEIQRQTGKVPGFYPEAELSNWWGKNAEKLSSEQRQKLKAFWLWAARYSRHRPEIPASIWKQWTLWQYSAGEHWYAKPNGGFDYKKKTAQGWEMVEDKKAAWPPAEQPPTVAETGWQWKAKEGAAEVEYKTVEPIAYDPVHFPVGVPGSAIPLECNFFLGTNDQLIQFWNKNGWTAIPK